ncbi:hypothetical protein E1264_37445 [Actinomadura sp. KC216]|uniref:hypothetical protein n=1 Tax=Actinomadura sp. KC216 TaxID=2530370 RepID=UPI0010529261|nr:hypothetical protein [Actinomadura sp. KC216]TDB77589.1 hypothetical protein E1264_37445 [Actinomadura sp. KC216]
MGATIIGIGGTLLGVLVGGLAQHAQAARTRRWQRADSLTDAKRRLYAEYLRAISASYAQALAGQRTRTEDAALLAATAEIEILAGRNVAEPARALTDTVLHVHARISDGASVPVSDVEQTNDRRLALIELLKADLGISAGMPWL